MLSHACKQKTVDLSGIKYKYGKKGYKIWEEGGGGKGGFGIGKRKGVGRYMASWVI